MRRALGYLRLRLHCWWRWRFQPDGRTHAPIRLRAKPGTPLAGTVIGYACVCSRLFWQHPKVDWGPKDAPPIHPQGFRKALKIDVPEDRMLPKSKSGKRKPAWFSFVLCALGLSACGGSENLTVPPTMRTATKVAQWRDGLNKRGDLYAVDVDAGVLYVVDTFHGASMVFVPKAVRPGDGTR